MSREPANQTPSALNVFSGVYKNLNETFSRQFYSTRFHPIPRSISHFFEQEITKIYKTIGLIAFVFGSLWACSSSLPKTQNVERKITPQPTELKIPGLENLPRAGGGLEYNGNNLIVFNTFPDLPNPARLYQSYYTASGWSTPVLTFPSFEASNFSATISPDGSRIYFESQLRNPAIEGREDSDLWVAERSDNMWSNAQSLGTPFDTPYNEHNVTISTNATICFNSDRPTVTKDHDILCSRRSTTGWDIPYPLSPAVNGSSADIAPFIDSRERFLLFASDRPGGLGSFDLYISINLEGEWQTAVNLGPEINSDADESNPTVSKDSQRLLFSRSVNGRVVPFEVLFDIHWLKNPN